MRTRATGTPFRVRAETDRLVITTAAGRDRVVIAPEFHDAWPFIERDAPKSHWQRSCVVAYDAR